MENIMRDITETNPVTPPVNRGRSLDYVAEIERFQSEIIKFDLNPTPGWAAGFNGQG